MTNTAWNALEAFMQRNEYLIDREYVGACRHYASHYDELGAFEVWRSTTNRYAPCMLEISRMTGSTDDSPGPHGLLNESYIRASLIHLAERIPVYAMLRTGKDDAVEALLAEAGDHHPHEALKMLSC